jgi:hypothetical protein
MNPFLKTSAVAFALCCVATGASADDRNPPTPAATTAASAGAGRSTDFDFMHGDWLVHNRRLRHPLRGGDAVWDGFDARQFGAPLMDGLANYDELRSDRDGLIGLSFRTFDKVARQWQVYWVANRDGRLQPAVNGAFADGVGIFEGDDVYDGKPIRVRYTWTGTATATPRWQQAFSADGGKTWETNWIMDFSRPR